jgi:hypothetical protein
MARPNTTRPVASPTFDLLMNIELVCIAKIIYIINVTLYVSCAGR